MGGNPIKVKYTSRISPKTLSNSFALLKCREIEKFNVTNSVKTASLKLLLRLPLMVKFGLLIIIHSKHFAVSVWLKALV